VIPPKEKSDYLHAADTIPSEPHDSNGFYTLGLLIVSEEGDDIMPAFSRISNGMGCGAVDDWHDRRS
jgi:hypothetical protein